MCFEGNRQRLASVKIKIGTTALVRKFFEAITTSRG